jgi:hypothetical protein
MGQPYSFEEQVQRNLPKVEARREFDGDRLWLTFYLSGQPDNLRKLSEALDARGWTNVQGGEGGFLYPKVHVEKTVTAIVEAAKATEQLCAPLGVEIIHIDADTSPDLTNSHFEILYRSRA